jgi:hypothetical protein
MKGRDGKVAIVTGGGSGLMGGCYLVDGGHTTA